MYRNHSPGRPILRQKTDRRFGVYANSQKICVSSMGMRIDEGKVEKEKTHAAFRFHLVQRVDNQVSEECNRHLTPASGSQSGSFEL
jgi:hypothetical protein